MSALYRIYAMLLRYSYVLRRSWPRVMELLYWPTVQMLIWGLISKFVVNNSDFSSLVLMMLLGAVLLWDVMFRSHLGVALVFFEEVYSNNLGHLYISPLRPYEHIISLLLISFIRTIVGVGIAAILAYFVYGFNLTSIGVSLIGFYLNLLIMGWTLGLVVVSLVIRYGIGAESLAWVVVFALAPLCAIYYPVSTLPEYLHPISYMLPATHVFEGLRYTISNDVISFAYMLKAFGLNMAYLSLAVWFYFYSCNIARKDGLLLQNGE